jgi:hypothetical protein
VSIASLLPVLLGVWLLTRLGGIDLFTPLVLILMGVLLPIQSSVQGLNRRIDALIKLLEENGTLK